MAACPAGTDIRTYNRLLQQNRLEEALDVLKRGTPFPALTGRVCFHPCESKCSRASMDESVNINALEQFLGDLDLQELPARPAVRHLSRAAVIGSGPAGLSAAWHLASEGWPVTVFEALPKPGGMLRYGIPAYRLPDAVIDVHIRKLEALGVEFRCNVRIGEGADLSLADLHDLGFRAVLLAPGLSTGKRLPLEGMDLEGIFTGVEFLRALRLGNTPAVGRRVCVVGGGNVAIDAAISAKLLGAEEVFICCLEDREHMPAFEHNIKDALERGVVLHPSLGPARIEGDGSVSAVVFKTCTSLFNEEGAFAPTFDESSEIRMEADQVIFAIGQTGDFADIASGVDMLKALGAVPVVMPMPDVYMALQKGTLDGVMADWEPIQGFRFYEVAKYVTTNTPFSYSLFTLIMNKAKFNSLPPEAKAAIEKHSGMEASASLSEGFAYSAREVAKPLADEGKVVIYELPAAERERWIKIGGTPAWENWVKDMEKKGFKNAREILDLATGKTPL